MYYSIHACRAAAAMLVVLFHLGGTFAQEKYFGAKAYDGLFSWGDAGVDFFFVLSGFIIATTHRADFGRPSRFLPYLRKRFTRIYPAYWIVFAALCGAAYAVPSFRQSMPDDPLVLLKSLALVPQNPAVVGGTGAPVLFVAWSLQYEMVFYGLFAVFILSRWAGVALCLVVLANFFACTPATECSFPRSFVASNFVLLFAAGVGVAALRRSRFKLSHPVAVALAAIAGFVATGLVEWAMRPTPLPVDRRLVYGVFAAAIIVGLAQAEDDGSVRVRGRVVSLLGDSSYALYLVHIPVISLLVKLAMAAGIRGGASLFIAYLAIFAATIFSAILFHVKLERPLIERLKRRRPVGRADVGLPAVSDRTSG